MDMGISFGLRIVSKSGKDIRVNIDSKIETESQSWGSESHSCSSSISLKCKLANSSMVCIGQVQGVVIKLNLSFQNTMILGPYQWG